MKKDKLALKYVIVVVAIVILTAGTTSYGILVTRKNEIEFNNFSSEYEGSKVQEIKNNEEKLATKIEEEVILFIESNKEIIDFYALTFGIEGNYIEDKIKELNLSANEFTKESVFKEGDYDSFDEELYFYITNNIKEENIISNNTLIISNPSKEYILGLIDYFSYYFPSVDLSIAKAIVNAESGFTATSMLSKNNVFGGMSGGTLITYKTIEYGIYSYMKLLNDGYFTQGLTTIESIGYKYNPVIEDGVKKASPSWVTKIYNYVSLYPKKEVENINDLLNINKSIEN